MGHTALALWRAEKLLLPYALHDALADRSEAVDTVSIYRTLRTLKDNDLAPTSPSRGATSPAA